jgi:predicted RNase H-like nuclease (RuvC/YqgF family)
MFKITSGLHLMQGPITVYEGSSYSGDARIADLQPKEERLLSYAIDLGSEVEPTAKRAPDRLLSVKINRGLVYRTNKIRQEKVYTIKNRSEHDRMLILEHPFQADFQLVEPKLVSERTREVYRFEIQVPKGETAKHTVIEERDLVQTVAMSNTNDTEIRFFLQSPEVSGKVKSAMKEATDKKNRIAEVQGEIQQVNRELKILLDDQTRLRANIAQLPQASDAYKRYLKKFDDQEPMIEKYQESLKTLQQREQELRQAFENYLATLTVE